MITKGSRKISWGSVVGSCALAGMLATSACGSSNSSGGSGGSSATGGAVGSGGATAATGGRTGTGGAATGTGGAATGTGGAATGTGGAATGTGGAATGTGGATATGGATGTGGAAGAGGVTSCAGRAISLAANGTGTASDAARARVQVDLMTDLPIGNAMRTIEYWAFIRTTDWVGEANTMFEYGTQGATAAGFGLDFGAAAVAGMAGNHATLDPYTNGGFDNDSTANLGITSTMNQWVHLAMVWDGTSLRTYVNGVLGITTNAAGATTMLATAQTQLTIGCNNPRFSCFGGYIDEFRVWNVARNATQIMTNYNRSLVGNEAGLVGYWKFDETAGTTVADSVTTAGHTAHPGTLMSVAAGQIPTFIVPAPLPPINCP